MSSVSNFTSILTSSLTWTEVNSKLGQWSTPATGILTEEKTKSGLYINSILYKPWTYSASSLKCEPGMYYFDDSGNIVIAFNPNSLLKYYNWMNPADKDIEIISDVIVGAVGAKSALIENSGLNIISIVSMGLKQLTYLLKLGDTYLTKTCGLSPINSSVNKILNIPDVGSLYIIADGPVTMSITKYSGGGGGGGSDEDALLLED